MARTWRIYRQEFLPRHPFAPWAPLVWTWEPTAITGAQGLCATLAQELTASTGVQHQIRSEVRP